MTISDFASKQSTVPKNAPLNLHIQHLLRNTRLHYCPEFIVGCEIYWELSLEV
jgi:hypothetical protein